MTTPIPNRPTSKLVVIAWIGSIPGLSTDIVAAQLPPVADKRNQPAEWVTRGLGFATVAVVGGSPDPDVPIRNPVMQIDCWAVAPGSNKPPWDIAERLAETIIAATMDAATVPRLLRITERSVEYQPAAVSTCYPRTEPRRVYDDIGDYARHQFDMQFVWQTVSRSEFV